MITRCALILVATFSGDLLAVECRELVNDPVKRLACFDEQAQKTVDAEKAAADAAAEKAKQANPESWLLKNLTVRESTGPNAKGPATLSLTRTSAESASVAKVGMTVDVGQVGLPDFLRDRGWSWYVSGAVNRDSTSKSPSNARLFDGGASGNFFRKNVDGFVLLNQVSLNGKDDRVAQTRSYGFAVETAIAFKKAILENGVEPYRASKSFSYNSAPRFGYFVDKFSSVKPGASAGTASGALIRFDGELYPNGTFWRFKLYADSRRALDIQTASGMDRRSSTYNKVGIDYALIDPHTIDKVIPSLSIERVVGSYFLDGTQMTRQTRLMFNLKVN